MSTEKGNLTINSENIFPIIKKWLYSDHDIFIRELISNGVDAVTKLKRLSSIGEADIPEGNKFAIKVMSSPLDKTITFIDNGIGMTRDEVDKYINQIAFSGAADFLEKYKDKDANDQIIGHFGLGFYSAFMVADKVTIETLSYQEGAEPVYWESDGGTSYEMSEGNYNERGTRITLYLADDSLEFANEYRVKEVINKYCSFMPVEIYYVNEDEAKKQEKEVEVETKAKVRKADEDDLIGDAPADDTSDADTAEEAVIDAEDTEEKDDKSPKPLNDINPLWMKTPGDCKDEDYKDFYQKVFYDFKEPMFWIHLNMDYPFNLKGILYFPRINPNIDQLEGKVKLYNNQVFVADNIKEVIPEFLLVLKGVIDCPDLPLNVSRSALQNDGFVKKISDYITKKVADKLTGMFKTDREKYESLWEDISPFIKFGCLKDDKFNEKMEKAMIFRNLEGKYISLQDYLDAAKEKHENKVFYVSDEQTQAQYIEMFKKEEMDAIFLTHNIDNPYITSMEAKNEGVKFLRIDSDISDSMKGEELSEDDAKNYKDKLTETFKKALNKEKLTLEVRSLKDESVSSMILQSEDQRRMADMMKIYSMGGMNFGDFGADAETLVLNVNNNLVKFVMDNPENELTPDVCSQLYDLAVLANRPLTAEELTRFVKRSNELLGKVIS
jgi:Molecular chaperone, HSP90 family